ncbi:MAG: sigma-70 family RNA polymerase sigma factor [Verrucomicrobia bacterium]|nr:sigma-70 family RNA polymerase sigma factor [Verrucomicrobiota bacterium]
MGTSRFAPFQKLLGITDEQLMWRTARHDDETAFTSLMCRWQSPILSLCFRMIGDPHRAEDLTQETFSRVFSQRKQYQPKSRFSTWLWRIALNLCYDELRAPQRREQPWSGPEHETGEPTLVSPEPTPDGHAAQSDEGHLVRQALGTLPETYRTVLVLRHYEDLKFREIAEILNVPEGTVKSRMAEALNLMNRRLQGTLESRATDHSLPAGRTSQKALP